MFKLLTRGNTKTLKGEKYGYMTFILHLAPAELAGVGNMCPKSTPACRDGCLNTAGRGGWFKPHETLESNNNVVQQARIRKTRYFVKNREEFMLELVEDVCRAIRYAVVRNYIPVIRLNGTSDISWEKYPVLGKANIFEVFPALQFYDYTKVFRKNALNIPNYHLVFSQAENNHQDVKRACQIGMPIAIVFDQVPEQYNNQPVTNGDDHDLRFLDQNQIIGLKAKGRAKKDTSGFVIRLN